MDWNKQIKEYQKKYPITNQNVLLTELGQMDEYEYRMLMDCKAICYNKNKQVSICLDGYLVTNTDKKDNVHVLYRGNDSNQAHQIKVQAEKEFGSGFIELKEVPLTYISYQEYKKMKDADYIELYDKSNL